jgi:hypothetical protein
VFYAGVAQTLFPFLDLPINLANKNKEILRVLFYSGSFDRSFDHSNRHYRFRFSTLILDAFRKYRFVNDR